MNQKIPVDPQELARIIKKKTQSWYVDQYNNQEEVIVPEELVKDLADYLEREDRKSKGRPTSKKKFYFDDFNKKQFLKEFDTK